VPAWTPGSAVILNVVKTTTPDRRQELVLAKANAIVNQVFVVSVNCAGPTGKGLSMIVDPEGNTIAATDGEAPVYQGRIRRKSGLAAAPMVSPA
jgi:predicted amidohydrolase